MKAIGIVRRIDDLGRVIIPKEIRRALRVREGDPLEIFIDGEGGVLFKKYSPIGNLTDFAQSYVDSLNKTSGHICIITDRDNVVAISGLSKRDYLQKNISIKLERILDEKSLYLSNTESFNVIEEQLDNFHSIVICPIICEGDPIGSVILATVNTKIDFKEVESKLTQSAANFLGKQMESE
jgi:AbrB family transcriptional regulator (stage V sporulation protein T)